MGKQRFNKAQKKALRKTDVSGSVCNHKKQERVDYGTNICKECGRLISTMKQTDR